MWQSLEAQQHQTGDFDYRQFESAVNELQYIVRDASAALGGFLQDELSGRFQALNATVLSSNTLDHTQPFTMHDMINGANDRYYPLQQLSWLMRTLDIECVMNYEMLLGGQYGGAATPIQSWTVVRGNVDTSDIDAFYLNVIAPAMVNGLTRPMFVNSMCNIPACESTVRELMTLLMTSVLTVTVPLREHVQIEIARVWAENGMDEGVHRFAYLCSHEACCNGTGILFAPPSLPPVAPPAPPFAPGALTPTPTTPPPSPLAPGCCACDAELPAPMSSPPLFTSPPPTTSIMPPTAASPAAAPTAAPPSLPAGPCGGSGLGGRTCSRCIEDEGCSSLIEGDGRCEQGIATARWAAEEGQKGLSCSTEDNSLLADISCLIANGTDGWSGGLATGSCRAKALYGANTAVNCFIPECFFAIGVAGAQCSNITCGQDLSMPGAQVDEAVAGFAAALTGALSVNCVAYDVDRQTMRCSLEIAGLSLLADCVTSRCIAIAAPPTPDYDPNAPPILADVDSTCAAQFATKFFALAIGVAGVAIGLILLIVGACSGGVEPPALSEPAMRLRSPPNTPMMSPPASPPAAGMEMAAADRWTSLAPSRANSKEASPCITMTPSSLGVVQLGWDEDPDELSQMISTISPLQQPPRLSWTDLSVAAMPSGLCGTRAVVVQETSGDLCGGCTALMGPSGSGKTTLLHAMTGLPHSGMSRSGMVSLNGMDVNTLPRGMVSLVPQDAVLPEELSAREALVFASALGLRDAGKAQRLALVEAILDRLGISSVANLPIGGRLAGRSGLSGGERKRVSVGMAVATCPHALLLDEPSSGLDAYSAFELVSMLKTLAKHTCRTVLVSVHQPSSQLFELFDGLILLAKGMHLYHGPPLDAVDALVSVGAPKKSLSVAPADHLLHVLVTHVDEMHTDALPIVPPHRRGLELSADSKPCFESQKELARRAACSCSTATEMRWLGWRCVAQLAREPALLRTQLAVHVLVALFMGSVFFQVQSDIAGFQNKAGSISFLLYFFALGGLSTSQTVTREWPLLWAEYHAGLYGVITYTVTRLLLELMLLRVLPAVAFSGIFYAMMGLKREALPFLRFLLAAALASADSALLCAAIAACAPRQQGAASLVATVALLACLLVAGFNLNLTALPEWIEWLAWTSFGRHAFEIMLCSELEGQMVDVDVPGVPPVRVRASVILGAMGLDSRRYASAFASLFLIGVVLVVVTALIVALQMRPSYKRSLARRPALRRQVSSDATVMVDLAVVQPMAPPVPREVKISNLDQVNATTAESPASPLGVSSVMSPTVSHL